MSWIYAIKIVTTMVRTAFSFTWLFLALRFQKRKNEITFSIQMWDFVVYSSYENCQKGRMQDVYIR